MYNNNILYKRSVDKFASKPGDEIRHDLTRRAYAGIFTLISTSCCCRWQKKNVETKKLYKIKIGNSKSKSFPFARVAVIYTRIILSYYYCKIIIIIPTIIHSWAVVCIFYISVYLSLRVADKREWLETKQLDSILLRRLYYNIKSIRDSCSTRRFQRSDSNSAKVLRIF